MTLSLLSNHRGLRCTVSGVSVCSFSAVSSPTFAANAYLFPESLKKQVLTDWPNLLGPPLSMVTAKAYDVCPLPACSCI